MVLNKLFQIKGKKCRIAIFRLVADLCLSRKHSKEVCFNSDMNVVAVGNEN